MGSTTDFETGGDIGAYRFNTVPTSHIIKVSNSK